MACERRKLSKAVRAIGLLSKATASSKSKDMASASLSIALAKSSGLEAGTKSLDLIQAPVLKLLRYFRASSKETTSANCLSISNKDMA